MKIFYVYELWVEGDEYPFYVGKTYKGSYRLRYHLKQYTKARSYKNYKISLALRNNKEIIEKVVFESSNEKLCFEKEKELIAFYGRADKGTGILGNHTDGGEGQSGISLSASAKISSTHRGNKYNVGRTISPEHKAIISKANRGKRQSTSSIQKRALACRKAVIVIHDDKVLYEFESVTLAAKKLNINVSQLISVLKGRTATLKYGEKRIILKYKV